VPQAGVSCVILREDTAAMSVAVPFLRRKENTRVLTPWLLKSSSQECEKLFLFLRVLSGNFCKRKVCFVNKNCFKI
jgi:hypothetical protein